MSRMARGEARNLQVVMHQLIWPGLRIVFPGEEFLLVVIAGSPGQHTAHIQFFSLDLPGHVLGPHALCGILIVRAACCVHVVISGIPSILGGIDPSLHLELESVSIPLRHFHALGFWQIFRAERARHRVASFCQRYRIAVVPVNLWLKEEIGFKSLRWIGVNPPLGIPNRECGNRRKVVFVQNTQPQLVRGQNPKEHRRFVSEADVLRPLAHVKA